MSSPQSGTSVATGSAGPSDGAWDMIGRVVFWLLAAAVAWAFLSPIPADLLGLGEWFLRADVLLGWIAFALTLPRVVRAPLVLRVLTGAVVALGLFELLTWATSGTSLLAGATSFGLLAFPFAVLLALLLAPPPPDQLRQLVALLVALAFLQIPFLLFQLPFSEVPEQNTGTFIGLGLGFHLCGVIAGAAVIWILGRSRNFRSMFLSFPLLLAPILTETRQVAFMLPIVLALSPAPDLKRWAVRLIAPVALVVAILLIPEVPGLSNSPGSRSTNQIADAVGGPASSRKIEGLEVTGKLLLDSPSNLLFGLGQGQSVGYLAMLGDRTFQRDLGPSVGGALGLDTSAVVRELEPRRGYGVLKNEFSSAFGIIGDLGVLGSLAFLVALGSVASLVVRVQGRNRGAVQALGLYYLGLGLIYIWWEQPVFTLYVALLIAAGLLMAGRGSDRPEAPQ